MLSSNRKAECLVKQLSASIDGCWSSARFMSLLDVPVHGFRRHFKGTPRPEVFTDVLKVCAKLRGVFVPQLVVVLQRVQEFRNFDAFLTRSDEWFGSNLVGPHFLQAMF